MLCLARNRIALILDLHHVHAIQVLLQFAHIRREVLHLPVDRKGEVMDHAVEVIHFEFNAFQALPQNETEVCLMLWHLDALFVGLGLLLLHLLLLQQESVLRASRRRSGTAVTATAQTVEPRAFFRAFVLVPRIVSSTTIDVARHLTRLADLRLVTGLLRGTGFVDLKSSLEDTSSLGLSIRG